MRRQDKRRLNRTVRWSSDEWRRVRFLAARAGLRASSYIRAVVLAEEAPVPRAPRTGRTRFREPRGRRCEVRFHAEEWARVERMANTLNLPPARFIREAAVGYRLAARVDGEAVRHLARLGGNLNQLTRLAHVSGQVTARKRLETVLAQIEVALDGLL